MRVIIIAINKRVPGSSALQIEKEYACELRAGSYLIFLNAERTRFVSIPRNQFAKMCNIVSDR